MSKQFILAREKKALIKQFLKNGERIDGRKNFEYREIEVIKNVIQNAEGSAIAKIGATQALAAIKLDIIAPFPNEEDRGGLIINAEFSPLATGKMEFSQFDENNIELSRVVDRAIRSSECIDMEKLFIEDGKVFGVFLDVYIIDNNGNAFDAALLASSLAIKNCRFPKVENGKIIREEIIGNLPLKNPLPLSCTFSKIDDYLLLDATYDEEIASDAQLIIATSGNYVCSIQKRGEGSIKKGEVLKLIDVSFEQSKTLRKYLE